MAFNPVIITGFGSLSPLGASRQQAWEGYSAGRSAISLREIGGQEAYAAVLHSSAEVELANLVLEKPEYKNLDRCVMLAILSARKAFGMSDWQDRFRHCGVTFGSSRGATGLFEHFHRSYLEHPRAQVSARSSPTTTLGNISSWVAQDLGLADVALSHSSTCSSAIHSVANALAWIRAGMAERFLAGGSEAPLTGFTLSQMQALGIYSQREDAGFACRPCALAAQNTFVLGEGAACFALESADCYSSRSATSGLPALLESVGVAMEPLTSPTSISGEADCIARAMDSALRGVVAGDVDALVLHAPGTRQGDEAELLAVRKVFGEAQPLLLSNKWLLGHTLGASGALSLEYALLLLQGLPPKLPPYEHRLPEKSTSKIARVMVNSAGFGGNAASLVVSALN